MFQMSFTLRMRIHARIRLLIASVYIASALFLGASPRSASAADSPAPVHGLWVWKSASVLEAPHAAESLRDFCASQGINEVYVSVSAQHDASDDARLAHLITLLHRSSIRVEALLSSADADEPGKHRDKLLDHVRGIIRFNEKHPADRFDGIHLDIEPQQRPENKGPGNLRFLPGLVDAFRAVLAIAGPAHLSVNADIQKKLLEGNLHERQMLMSALPRLTLMFYEISGPNDGQTAAQQTEKLRTQSQKFLDMAYDGLSGPNLASPNLAKMIIALRTPDYASSLPQMLQSLDDDHRANPHYLGWARHSYNDYLNAAH
jgi:hypothetical protein